MIVNSITGGKKKATPLLQAKTVTPMNAAQTVRADREFDALGSVTVNGDGNLISSNIKYGVTIFGTTGNYESTTTATYTISLPVGTISLTPSLSDFYEGERAYWGRGLSTYEFGNVTVTRGDISGVTKEISFTDKAPSTWHVTESAWKQFTVTTRSLDISGTTTLPNGNWRVRIPYVYVGKNLESQFVFNPLDYGYSGYTEAVNNIHKLTVLGSTTLTVKDGNYTGNIRFTPQKSDWGSTTMVLVTAETAITGICLNAPIASFY